ncbi:MFS transporter [Candidatus Magnetominusculus xianensis]|uniref:MFS transporter n=1 Tax=Candidatus Magnetominusculus xianensis TaxID=1748249 RepID=A0ABR5SD63_9BACT|nr:MFS transporter [Candidatus Magnetominusculus xianensis]KWT82781.1 MFS transporter [Candidatus Magnetominusculus xianensis]MBF0403470.1 MFS transporter [Nitrospirota bacterium]
MGTAPGVTAPLYFVGFFARFSYALARSPVLSLFAMYLGAGPEAIGLAVGISTVTGIFFKLPSGALSDIIGRRRTMLIGLCVFAIMPFTYMLVHDYRMLVIVRFLHGFATAVYGPVAMAVVAEIAGEKRGEALSWFSSVTIIGNLVGAPVGGYLLHHGVASKDPILADFQIVYIISGVLGVISLLIGIKYLKGKETVEKGKTLKESFKRFASGIKEVVSDKRVLITSNMEGVQNMCVGALEAFLPVYCVKVAGLNEFQAGLLWGVQVVSTIVSKPVMGRNSDKYGRVPIIAVGLAMCALSFGAIPLLTSFYLLMVVAVVFGLGEAFVTSSSAALVADICKEKHYGTAMGTFGTIYDIGHASGPIVTGLLLAKFNNNYQYSFWIVSALVLLIIPVFVMTVRVKKT